MEMMVLGIPFYVDERKGWLRHEKKTWETKLDLLLHEVEKIRIRDLQKVIDFNSDIVANAFLSALY